MLTLFALVSASLWLSLPKLDGEVALAINEPVMARKDNRGTIKARIMVDP